MAADRLVGVTINGQYVVNGIVGDEVLGRVYLASDVRTGVVVEIKQLWRDQASDPERVRRFKREVESTARFSHVNLVKNLDTGYHDGLPYVVFQYRPGRSLAQSLEQGRVEPIRAVQLTMQILSGIDAAHREGVVHRNLTPYAIRLVADPPDGVEVRDFGLADLVSVEDQTGTLTRHDARVGNASAMAPEYVNGEVMGPKADHYALGVLLFQLLTGRPPFVGRGSDILAKKVAVLAPAPSTVVPDLPEWADPLLAKLLHPEPARRPPVDEVMAEFRWILRGARPSFKPERMIDSATAILGLVLVAVVSGAGGLALLQSTQQGQQIVTEATRLQRELTAQTPVVPPEPEIAVPEAVPEVWLVPPPIGTTAAAAVIGSRPNAPSTSGRISIRADQRALVTIDGVVVGYSPIDVWVPIGRRSVTASLPSRPETRQQRDAALVADEHTTVDFDFPDPAGG